MQDYKMKHNNRLHQWIYTLIIFSLPMMSYCILSPLEVYFGNEKDFEFAYTDFFVYICIGAVIVWAVSSFAVVLLSNKLYKLCNVAAFCFGVASYMQNMFMNRKLSEDDGAPMRWETLGNYPIINLFLWIAIVVGIVCLYIFAKKWWQAISVGMAAFLSAIQLVAVLVLVFTAVADEKVPTGLSLSGDEQFQIASEENIIVLVLDSYGTARFETALNSYPEMKQELKDFTYYNNMDCHYYCTFPSMTHILTGRDFDFDTKSSQTWLQEAWTAERTDKFYEAVHSKGYVWNLFSTDIGYAYGSCENMSGKIDNIKGAEKVIDHFRLIKLMGRMSFYKHMPYVLKPRFEVLTQKFGQVVSYQDAAAVIDDNVRFYQTLKQERLSVNKGMPKAVIMQHLSGLHAPYTMDELGNEVEEAAPEQTARGSILVVNEYLQQLKELGLYEDAAIMIMSDHGAWHGGDTQSIFLLKESGVTQDEMQVNNAPVSMDDFQATTLAILGLDYEGFGTSIYDWNSGDTRERTVYRRTTDKAYPEVKNSSWNVYYEYTYYTDRQELNRKSDEKEYRVVPATPWD